jgi:predicted DCC family thiol-disulfide oxidoreductase YuxK
MRYFTVVYDARCGICSEVRNWLDSQSAIIPLRFVAAGSAEARARFPALPTEELAVISDENEVWFDERAWIMCLWALQDYRRWAYRFSQPALAPLARKFATLVARNRHSISRLLRLSSDSELTIKLNEYGDPACQVEPRHQN